MENEARQTVVSLSGPVNLKATLECGQAFRWRKAEFPGHPDIPIAYRGVIGPHALVVGQTQPVTDEILVRWTGVAASGEANQGENSVSDMVRDYFAAADDVESIEAHLVTRDDVMAQAVRYGRGLRILKQDPWECLGSYVLSLNNSIPNISRIVEYLCSCYGEPAGVGEFSFPSPKAIACQEVSSLRRSKCGFRDRYLHDAANKVTSGDVDLKAIESMPTPLARQELMKIAGVGPKVADCVLLFSFHRLEVFPVDVWIARAVSEHYLGGRPVKPQEARQEGERRFGDLAGYAQEYLFYWMRQAIRG